MIDEFDLPMEIVDRKARARAGARRGHHRTAPPLSRRAAPLAPLDRQVTKMKMISPSNRAVDVGKTLSEKEYIGMCRREVRAGVAAPAAAPPDLLRRPPAGCATAGCPASSSLTRRGGGGRCSTTSCASARTAWAPT